jgi:hypothetical protein
MKLEEICIKWFPVTLHIGQCRPANVLKIRQLRERARIANLYSDQGTDWTAEESGIDFRQEQQIFLFPIASRPAVGLSRTPMLWIPRPKSSGASG